MRSDPQSKLQSGDNPRAVLTVLEYILIPKYINFYGNAGVICMLASVQKPASYRGGRLEADPPFNS